MLNRLAARFRRRVFVKGSRDALTFATDRDEVTIAAGLRVDSRGRILGFGTTDGGADEQTVAVFESPSGGVLSANARALEAVCRRGLSLVLGRWPTLRPRVVLDVPPDMTALTDVLTRALRRAGAASVECARVTPSRLDTTPRRRLD